MGQRFLGNSPLLFMASRKPGFYSTIEYIGPRPSKPKRQSFFGGWVILLIAVGIGFWFGRPLVPLLKAEGASNERAESVITVLRQSPVPAHRLAAAALAYSSRNIAQDGNYYQMTYPKGDIPEGKGNAADVLIRCMREVGVDLQEQVHRDMTAHFRVYPQLWNAKHPDANIDHRRVANLQRFLERKGTPLTTSREASDYQPGDIVIWSLANAEKHIGIVVPGPGEHMSEPWVVHQWSDGVKWENALFDYRIEAHVRYPVESR